MIIRLLLKESHFFQRTEDGIYGIGVNKLGFHFCMLGCEIFERFLLSCNFGMLMLASLVYDKDCPVLRGMVRNVLIILAVSCFYEQLCF